MTVFLSSALRWEFFESSFCLLLPDNYSIGLTPTIIQAQIAFALMVIVVAVVYYVFTKKPTRPKG